MSHSYIPIAVWRKSPSTKSSTHRHRHIDIDLNLVRQFLHDIRQPNTAKRLTTPSKIPVPIATFASSTWDKKHYPNSLSSSNNGSPSPPPTSSGSNSDSDSLSPTPNIHASLLYAYHLTQNFPSSKSRSPNFKEHMNWTKPLPGLRRESSRAVGIPAHIDRIQETAELLQQISAYLQPHSQRETSSSQKDDAQYISDILENEFEKEERYQRLLANNVHHKVNIGVRGKVVEWIISAAIHFKYATETVYIAVFLMDSFVGKKPITASCWPLLGLTAFHIAGKTEETNRVTLSKIWRYYKSLAKHTLIEVTWMEEEILRALNFQVSPPMPKVFSDLAIHSDHISFPSKDLKQLIKKLVDGILIKSLEEYEMSKVPSSYKADLAIQIATEYVMFYQNIYVRELSKTKTGESEIIKNAKKICYSLFRSLVRQKFEKYFRVLPPKEIARGF